MLPEPASLAVPASTQAAGVDPDLWVRRHTRHNVLALGLDLALFLVGLSFASSSTILPAFAAYLGAPNVVIGAIPALMTVGWLLPSLFAAAHTETLAKKLPFILRYTVWERAPLLVLAVVGFVVADLAPRLALGIVLLMLLVMAGVGGILMPAWMDIVGRAIPTPLRGRFFAVASILGGVGGLVGAFGTTFILDTIPPPASFGVCFLGGAFFMGLSYVALRLTQEPPTMSAARVVPLRTYLTQVPSLLRRDRNLSWFLTARACAVVGMMANGFYTVYALRTYAALPWWVGVFTTALLSGQIVGNLILGWLADRAGHRLVLIVGVGASVAANAIALLAPSLNIFTVVFTLAGVQIAALNVSGLAILLEFAPAHAEQPTYVGLGNTAVALPAFAAPLVAGFIADDSGFAPVFAVAAVFGLAGLVVFIGRVRDPRGRPAPSEH